MTVCVLLIQHVLKELRDPRHRFPPVTASRRGRVRGGLDKREQVPARPGRTQSAPRDVWQVEQNALQTQHEWYPLVVG